MVCECKRKAVSFRRTKGNRLRIFADKGHTLCTRCQNAQFEAEKQRQLAEKREIVKEIGNSHDLGR